MKVGVLSVVPSPYQRDMFRALNALGGIDLSVSYLEEAAPDSPWPREELEDWESVLPGRTIGRGRVRCHLNSGLPDPGQFDAFIVNSSLTAASTQGMMRRLEHRRNQRWYFWGEVLRERRGWRRAIQNRLAAPLRRASAIVAIGSRAREDYRRRFPATRLEEIPYHCDIAEFQKAAAHRIPNVTPVFLFCGQMIQRKGIDVLLAAFERVITSGSQARLVLAGRDDELPILPDAVRPHIELAGFHAPQSLPALFARADVFVLPSRHDGWGVVVNQAIASGLPIISTEAVGAAVDLVEHESNGLIVPPGEIEPLAEAMRRLATDAGLRQAMSLEARTRADALTPAAGAERWLEVLTKTPPED